MLRRVLIFLLLLRINLIAIDYNEEGSDLGSGNEPVFVSLGGACNIALALRANGLRKQHFPLIG